jgi:hypothetical protein
MRPEDCTNIILICFADTIYSFTSLSHNSPISKIRVCDTFDLMPPTLKKTTLNRTLHKRYTVQRIGERQFTQYNMQVDVVVTTL